MYISLPQKITFYGDTYKNHTLWTFIATLFHCKINNREVFKMMKQSANKRHYVRDPSRYKTIPKIGAESRCKDTKNICYNCIIIRLFFVIDILTDYQYFTDKHIIHLKLFILTSEMHVTPRRIKTYPQLFGSITN